MKKKWLLAFSLLIMSCAIDQGLGTMDSYITGRVIFLNPEQKPDYVEAVRMVAIINMPPQNLGDVIIANTSVNLSREEPTYSIPAPYAAYRMIAAIWKEKGKAWDYTNILGFYGFDPVTYTIEDKVVDVTKEHPIAENIDIYCDWSLL